MGVVIISVIVFGIIAKIYSLLRFKDFKLKVNKRFQGATYFHPKKSVSWFDFYGLYKSFLKIADSGKTLEIIDKREVISTFGVDNIDELKMNESEAEKWIDFLADTGDGFNSTTTLFHHVTRKELYEGSVPLKRGSVCIIGGDLVYPDASEEEYNNRFKGPIRLVFPYNSASLESGEPKPILLAMPGNHDWYDGCSAFIRMMCQQKTIGGFATVQHKTYFAFTILPNLHLVGVDNQLAGDIDIPQLNYFKNYVASLSKDMTHNVLLFVAEPNWYNYHYKERMQYRQRMDSLEYLIMELKKVNSSVTIKAILAGDIHHYARYESAVPEHVLGDKPMLITSGGGGAFKHLTHKLETYIHIPSFECPTKNHPSTSVRYKRATEYPSFDWSRRHLLLNLLFAVKNLSFTFSLGILLWGILALSGWHPYPIRYTQYVSGVLILPAIYWALLSAVESKETSQKTKNQFYIWGLIFILLVAVVNAEILFHWISKGAEIQADEIYIPDMLLVGLKCLLMAFINNTLFGIFLLLRFSCTGKNHTEASSSNIEEGFNNFVRMKITKDEICFYVIGIDKAYPFLSHISKAQKGFEEGEENFDKDLNDIFHEDKPSYKIIDTFNIKLN